MTGMSAAPGAAAIEELAHRRLSFERLRPGQLGAVEALAGGRDVLAVLPTGGGKSAIYELAGLLRAGPTVVVSPLIALQDDQLAHLHVAGLPAIVLNSQQSAGGPPEQGKPDQRRPGEGTWPDTSHSNGHQASRIGVPRA